MVYLTVLETCRKYDKRPGTVLHHIRVGELKVIRGESITRMPKYLIEQESLETLAHRLGWEIKEDATSLP